MYRACAAWHWRAPAPIGQAPPRSRRSGALVRPRLPQHLHSRASRPQPQQGSRRLARIVSMYPLHDTQQHCLLLLPRKVDVG